MGGLGLFIKARRPSGFVEKELRHYKLYSIIQDRKSSTEVNSFYWGMICFPIYLVFRNSRYAARIVDYLARPVNILRLIKRTWNALMMRFLTNRDQ